MIEIEDHTSQIVESAAKLLEVDGYILRPGIWGRWLVAPATQGCMLGWSAILLPSQS